MLWILIHLIGMILTAIFISSIWDNVIKELGNQSLPNNWGFLIGIAVMFWEIYWIIVIIYTLFLPGKNKNAND